MAEVDKSAMAMDPLDMKVGKTKVTRNTPNGKLKQTQLLVQASKRRSTESEREKQGESQHEPALSEEILQARRIMRRISEVAATGRWGYIAIDPGHQVKGIVDEWLEAAAGALADSKRFAYSLSYYSVPLAKSNSGGKKVKKVTSIVVCFRTTDELEKALGPISIMGFSTQLERFRGPKGRTFRIPLPPGACSPNGEKICRAFEEKAMARLEAWGWRQFWGAKSHFVLQCQLPPLREVNAIKVDGWQLECTRVEEGECCCCREDHNCFTSGIECSQFALGHKRWYD